jgi:hypothetical protein
MMPRHRNHHGRHYTSPRWPADLKAVWSAPPTDARLKKRIVRAVIHEVVADIDDEASEIVLLTHWIGGVHTELRLPRRRRGQRNSISADMLATVRHVSWVSVLGVCAGCLCWVSV